MLETVNDPLKAADLLPLIQRLPASEQILLAKLALQAAAAHDGSDGDRYIATAPTTEELGTDDDDPLAWDADGWEEFDAPR